MSVPPMSSTTTSMPGSSTTARASPVTSIPSRSQLRARPRFRTAARVTSIPRPARRAISPALRRSTLTVPDPTVPSPSTPMRIGSNGLPSFARSRPALHYRPDAPARPPSRAESGPDPEPDERDAERGEGGRPEERRLAPEGRPELAGDEAAEARFPPRTRRSRRAPGRARGAGPGTRAGGGAWRARGAGRRSRRAAPAMRRARPDARRGPRSGTSAPLPPRSTRGGGAFGRNALEPPMGEEREEDDLADDAERPEPADPRRTDTRAR